MASVIIHDPSDPTVANRVTIYLPSVNTPDYTGNPNAVVNPDLANVAGVPVIYWKYTDPDVVEMSAAEKQAIDDATPPPSADLVRVLEEDDLQRTQGHYKSQGLEMSVPASTGVHSADFSFPVPISLMSMEYVPEASMDGDHFNALVGPETIIGSITSDVTATDTVINVSSTVLDNIQLGYIVHLDDLTNKDKLGQVTAIDKLAGTITVETGAVNGFAAATPTYVKQTVCMAENIRLSGTVRIELGSTKIGGSYLPAGTVIRIEYDNISGTAKTFAAIAEFLY